MRLCALDSWAMALALLLAAAPPSPHAEMLRWQHEAARVTIVRDDWGIAHVHGATDSIGGDVERISLEGPRAFYGEGTSIAALPEAPADALRDVGSNGIALAPSITQDARALQKGTSPLRTRLML